LDAIIEFERWILRHGVCRKSSIRPKRKNLEGEREQTGLGFPGKGCHLLGGRPEWRELPGDVGLLGRWPSQSSDGSPWFPPFYKHDMLCGTSVWRTRVEFITRVRSLRHHLKSDRSTMPRSCTKEVRAVATQAGITSDIAHSSDLQ